MEFAMSKGGSLSFSDFNLRIDAQSVPRTGQHVKFTANAEALEDIAKTLGIAAAHAVTGDLDIRPWGRGGYRVEGEVVADVAQLCVVTLEPVDEHIHEAVSLTFMPAKADEAHEAQADEHEIDDFEPLEDGFIPLGAAIRDTVSLALNPYPRAEGVELPEQQEERDGSDSPFAALRKLKQDN